MTTSPYDKVLALLDQIDAQVKGIRNLMAEITIKEGVPGGSGKPTKSATK